MGRLASLVMSAMAVGLALPAEMAAARSGQAPSTPLRLWRLDCGDFDVPDFGPFSDTHRYDGRHRRMVGSCYLIRHGASYMLWDTGVDGPVGRWERKNDLSSQSLRRRIVAQLSDIGVTPAMVRYVGISHYHADHIGQASDFPGATLLIGAQDWKAVRADDPEALPVDGLAPWIGGGSKVDAVSGDRDVFGDGTVTMLAMPGHTPGHHALLLHLAGAGWVILSGDQFHASESMATDQVPVFNYDRAETLASSARLRGIARRLRALVVIQHEPGDVAKLPTFPKALD